MTIEVQPLRRAEGDRVVDGVLVSFVDDMHILHAEAVAAAQTRARIVLLVDILDNDRDMAGPVEQKARQQFAFMLGEESGEVRTELNLIA